MKKYFFGALSLFCVLLGTNIIMTVFAQSQDYRDGVPVGTISAWAGKANATPFGWRVCDGASLKRAQHFELFAAIGTVWGTEDEESFNLPDLRGRFLRGVDFGTNRDPDAGEREPCSPGGNTMGVGTVQEDSIKNHTHAQQPHTHGESIINTTHVHTSTFAVQAQAGGVIVLGGPIGSTHQIPAAEAINEEVQALGPDSDAQLSAESRPENAYVVYIIKVTQFNKRD